MLKTKRQAEGCQEPALATEKGWIIQSKVKQGTGGEKTRRATLRRLTAKLAPSAPTFIHCVCAYFPGDNVMFHKENLEVIEKCKEEYCL